MKKIVIIGAGSGFGGRLSKDILSHKALQDYTIALCDLNFERLNETHKYVQKLIDDYKLPAKVISSIDRCDLLEDAEFVMTAIAVGGAYAGYPYIHDVMIPKKYGIDQAVADTCSVGAIFRFFRVAAATDAIFRDIERLCPKALVLNHTNPMAMLTQYCSKYTTVKNVGLCHGIKHSISEIATYMGLEKEKFTYKVAGINHMAWFLKMNYMGKDIYPEFKKMCAEKQDGGNVDFVQYERTRIELMQNFGCYPTEAAGHDSEYLPYFRKDAETMKEYMLSTNNPSEIPETSQTWLKHGGEKNNEESLVSSDEYTGYIVNSIVTDVPFAFNGNVINDGLIDNLPCGACVEVKCISDHDGVTPCHFGALPIELAALNSSNISVQQMAVEAFAKKDKELAFRAVALDPNVAAKLTL
ncbi:MAG: alpha-glucosidase/alpha-galactosidase, partial [Oscillospiraceae bacterium]